VVGWLDITAEELPERLNFFSKFEKLRGLRHIVQADDQFMLREAFVLGISRLSEFNLSYDILVYPRQLSAAIGLVNKFPEQRFVVDHIAKPPIKTNKITDWAERVTCSRHLGASASFGSSLREARSRWCFLPLLWFSRSLPCIMSSTTR
jgi:L-fuconolactonase